jgi:hypothetical protein
MIRERQCCKVGFCHSTSTAVSLASPASLLARPLKGDPCCFIDRLWFRGMNQPHSRLVVRRANELNAGGFQHPL